MNGKYLLDTNIVIALFANDTAVQEHLAAAEAVFVPSIVMGELYYGARKSNRAAKNIARLDQFAAHAVVLACDVDAARRYGEVKNDLRQKGQPIPENDIWIAAVALEHGLTLATRDTHFGVVDRLSLETW